MSEREPTVPKGIAAARSVEDPPTVAEARRLLHDLRVHQVELETQNAELRRTQVALDEARRRYFDLYEHAPVGYVTLGVDGTIREANLRACGMLGRSREHMIGTPLSRLVDVRDREGYDRHRQQVRAGDEAAAAELRMQGEGSEALWVRMETTRVVDEAGGLAAYRSTLSDVTAQRMADLRMAQNDRMVSMGLLAAGVAHEINNPLTYVLSHLEVLADGLPRLTVAVERLCSAVTGIRGEGAVDRIVGEGRHLLQPDALRDLQGCATEALGGARRVRDVARGLTAFSRVEEEDAGPIDLNAAAREAMAMARNEVESRAELVTDLGTVPPVAASGGKVAQVLLNLLVNAAHAIEAGDVRSNRISVRTWFEGGRAHAAVSDTGRGISPQDLERVFEPFFTRGEPGRGLGLGLSIAQRVVRGFGGDIRVDSRLGAGTRVVIDLPAAADGGRPRPGSSPAELASTATTPGEARGRVLVIDDEPIVRKVVERMLAGYHDVLSASTGSEARELLERDSAFDVILCDLMMPDVTGTQLHAWLEEHMPEAAKRVVFMTGGVFSTESTEYLARVRVEQIDKPISRAGLLELVAERVRPGRGGS